MVQLGAATALVSTIVLALIAVTAPTIIGLLLPLMTYMIGIGMVSPNSQAGAIGPFPAAAGAASSLLGFLQMSIAAGVGAVLGHLEARTSIPMAVAILLTVCGLNLTYWLVLRPTRS
jgi:DHA1 family bicyclomycin/chloramphenicol resistance-like MFS transporter